MKIAIVPNGPRAFGSSRMRGWWLQDAAPDLFRVLPPSQTEAALDADLIVFQKRQGDADLALARRAQQAGKCVVYDLCDPIWWWKHRDCVAMAELADAVVCSNEGLARALSAVAPGLRRLEIIPDRMPRIYHPETVQHGSRDEVTLVWYGATGNRWTLYSVLPQLGWIAGLVPLRLVVMDSAPEQQTRVEDMPWMQIDFIPWTVDSFHAQLMACDIALIPPYPGPWGAMKSNNRQVTAWWAGLPVVTGYDAKEMLLFLESHEARAERAASMRAVAEREWEIGKSVQEWRALAERLLSKEPARAAV